MQLASFFVPANCCDPREDFPEVGEKGQQLVPYGL